MASRKVAWVAAAMVGLGVWWALGAGLVRVIAGAEEEGRVQLAARSVVAKPTVVSSGAGSTTAPTIRTTPAITVAGPAPALGVIEVLDESQVPPPTPVMAAACADPCPTQPSIKPLREPCAITPPMIIAAAPAKPCGGPAIVPRCGADPGGRGGGGGPAPVPEPATLALAGVAGAALAAVRGLRKRRQRRGAPHGAEPGVT